jgi:hypothetical protein
MNEFVIGPMERHAVDDSDMLLLAVLTLLKASNTAVKDISDFFDLLLLHYSKRRLEEDSRLLASYHTTLEMAALARLSALKKIEEVRGCIGRVNSVAVI